MMMKSFGKICWPVVLAGLMCAVVLAPTVILSVHLAATCRDCHSDCPDRPLTPHQHHQCSICMTADAVIGKSLSPAPIVVCGTLAPVSFLNVERRDAVDSLYPHTKLSRAPPVL